MSRYLWPSRPRWTRLAPLAVILTATFFVSYELGIQWRWIALWGVAAAATVVSMVRPVLHRTRDGGLATAFPYDVPVAVAAVLGLSMLLWPSAWDIAAVMSALSFFLGMATRRAYVRRTVRLRPDIVDVPSGFGRVLIPWDALASEQPPVHRDVAPLRLSAPERVRTRGRVRRFVNVVELRGDSLVIDDLVKALDFYIGHPAARASIGTAEGLAELKLAMRADPAGVEAFFAEAEG